MVLGRVPVARHATRAVFRDAGGEVIDEGIALHFAAPHSYTGEDVLELQGHGGPMVMQALLAACVDGGARLAEPGEFTRRAYLNGRLDLAQAEAVADVIDAASREAARSAARSLTGEFSSAIRELVAQFIDLRALVEAMLDFPEEQIDAIHRDDAVVRLERLEAALRRIRHSSQQGSLLRNGIHVVLAGRPNVGKSSLLNCLSGADRAIVTAIAGTTRDALREPVVIEGVPLVLVDTAGLREPGDEIERIGIERAHSEVAQADIVIAVSEVGEDACGDLIPVSDSPTVRVLNKIDLANQQQRAAVGGDVVAVSARTGEGIDLLRKAILRTAGWVGGGEPVFLARERHLRALDQAYARIQSARSELQRWELLAEELRLAQLALGEITGETSADDLLGEIFSRFCIGK